MLQSLKNIYHLAQAFIASCYFNFPSKNLIVIGVTGTDGKTTTATMINQALVDLGQKVSMVTTVEAKIGTETIDTGFHVTTPSPWQVQKFLKQALNSGSKYFVLEATSHGLDQNRLAFVNFHIGILTNITNEHLDYHGSWQNYARAKSRLFKNVKYSILNKEDKSYDFIKKTAGGKIITYSLKNEADFNLKNTNLILKIAGAYNHQNALAALAVLSILNFPKQQIIKSLDKFEGVQGRLEGIVLGQNFKAIVDFAHTPNSLEQVLKNLKTNLLKKRNRLIAVFGAAGERDKGKRQAMGEIAAKFADISIITAEDPRSEDVKNISEEIAAGFRKQRKIQDKDFYIINNRKEAINFAVNLAKRGDIIGFFGKGHEKSMCFGKKEYPWDETDEVSKAIKKLK